MPQPLLLVDAATDENLWTCLKHDDHKTAFVSRSSFELCRIVFEQISPRQDSPHIPNILFSPKREQHQKQGKTIIKQKPLKIL